MRSAEGAERRERQRDREGEGERERGRLQRWEFWGNSENVVFSGGATFNQPSTMRGALPSVCRVTPPPLLRDSGPPCCARFATSAKSRAAVTSEETKEPQERGGREGGGVDMQRMRGGTAQVGSFTDQQIIIDHPSSVIKSIIDPCCVSFGTCES